MSPRGTAGDRRAVCALPVARRRSRRSCRRTLSRRRRRRSGRSRRCDRERAGWVVDEDRLHHTLTDTTAKPRGESFHQVTEARPTAIGAVVVALAEVQAEHDRACVARVGHCLDEIDELAVEAAFYTSLRVVYVPDAPSCALAERYIYRIYSD